MRLIARLDIKNEFLIKGIHLEGLRKIGDPVEFCGKYYEAGIDEIVLVDAVASLYQRNGLFHILETICKQSFVPITIGGGLRSVEDMERALKAGADKVAFNTAVIQRPELISECARIFGSQAVVVSIEAKSIRGQNKWEAYYDNGREHSHLDVLEWAQKVEALGAGEILLTSIDQEGTKRGLDFSLTQQVVQKVGIPVVASGGIGSISHISEAARIEGLSGIAVASVLHYGILPISQMKEALG